MYLAYMMIMQEQKVAASGFYSTLSFILDFVHAPNAVLCNNERIQHTYNKQLELQRHIHVPL